MVCKQCGKKLKDGETICAHCGAKVSKRKNLGSAGKRRRKRQVQRMRAIIVCAAAAVAIVVAIIGIRAVWNSKGLGRDTQTSEKEVSEANARSENVLSRFIGSFSVNVGDTLTFGSYEQDGDIGNGAEPIEWRVLDVQGGRVLLISVCILEFKKYNDNGAEATWETCTLRSWLNNELYNAAFSFEEQSRIIETELDNSIPDNNDNRANTEWETNSTSDKLFCLSFEEVQEYYKDGYFDEAKSFPRYLYHQLLLAKASKYARSDENENYVRWTCLTEEYYDYCNLEKYGYDRSVIGDTYYQWWLRSMPGDYHYKSNANNVFSNGCINLESGYSCDKIDSFNGARPAMWIKRG